MRHTTSAGPGGLMSHGSVGLYWSVVDEKEIDGWNQRLLGTSGSYFQYPFWGESFRQLHFRPVYVVCHDGSKLCAFACILTLGLSACRIGLVQRGPVNLLSDAPVPLEAVWALRDWAARNGFVFLRFDCGSEEQANSVRQVTGSVQEDAFPFYSGVNSHQLLVRLLDDDEKLLAEFQSVARRQIKAARKIGYEIRTCTEPQELAECWPVFKLLAQRKQLVVRRPLSMWMDLMRRAAGVHGVRLYTARLDGVIVQAILILRDSVTAEYTLGALDVDKVRGKTSPSCLLHWHAMLDCRSLGSRLYDLGHPSGPAVYQFKRKFQPFEHICPSKVTIVTRPTLYNVWSKCVLLSRTGLLLWPKVREFISRTLKRNRG